MKASPHVCPRRGREVVRKGGRILCVRADGDFWGRQRWRWSVSLAVPPMLPTVAGSGHPRSPILYPLPRACRCPAGGRRSSKRCCDGPNPPLICGGQSARAVPTRGGVTLPDCWPDGMAWSSRDACLKRCQTGKPICCLPHNELVSGSGSQPPQRGLESAPRLLTQKVPSIIWRRLYLPARPGPPRAGSVPRHGESWDESITGKAGAVQQLRQAPIPSYPAGRPKLLDCVLIHRRGEE